MEGMKTGSTALVPIFSLSIALAPALPSQCPIRFQSLINRFTRQWTGEWRSFRCDVKVFYCRARLKIEIALKDLRDVVSSDRFLRNLSGYTFTSTWTRKLLNFDLI